MPEFGQPIGTDEFAMPSYLEGDEIWIPRITAHAIGIQMHQMPRQIEWRGMNGGLGKMPQIGGIQSGH
jgi:hypothetical protein